MWPARGVPGGEGRRGEGRGGEGKKYKGGSLSMNVLL